jgi:glutathionylspermidine synthase
LAVANQPVPTVDDRLKDVAPLPKEAYQKWGLGWYRKGDNEDYLAPELLRISNAEVSDLRLASQKLWELIEQATEAVISKNQLADLHVPGNMAEAIRLSWQDKRQLPLVGRFDLAGGIGGLPIKLLEFNADTPSLMPETAWLQAEAAQQAGPGHPQFNDLLDSLSWRLDQLKSLNPDLSPVLLVSSLGSKDDELNAKVIAAAGQKAGFEVLYKNLEEVHFSAEEGIFAELRPGEWVKCDFWFKLIPWEWIALEEPDLMELLTGIIRQRLAVVVNPPYSVVQQSKSLMKVLWDMFPGHPLLLKTTHKEYDFRQVPYVAKVCFGRQGENIEIYNEHALVVDKRPGDFGTFARVYQAFARLPKDREGNYYQACVFYCRFPAALCFRRRDALIIDDDAEFIPHYISG